MNDDYLKEILDMTMAGKEGSKRLRVSWPSKWNFYANVSNTKIRRAYYLWRMTRFHGGADTTMPMTAMSAVEGDLAGDFLDRLSWSHAKVMLGTSNGAVNRWAPLLGLKADSNV